MYRKGSSSTRELADVPDSSFAAALDPVVTEYEAWIEDLAARAANPTPDLAPYENAAAGAITLCREAARRIRAGVALLDADGQAAEAFRFANRAMAEQRDRTIFSEQVRQDQEPDLAAIVADPGTHSWRLTERGILTIWMASVSVP